MLAIRRCFAVAAAVLLLSATPALGQDAPTDDGAAKPAQPVLEVEQMVNGTCRTAREAMLQLLYWVQEDKGRVDKAKAAACMDGSAITTNESLPELAYKLKRTLDVQGLYVDPDAIPNDPDYVNPGGESRWRLPDLDSVQIVKVGDKWVFSAATVKRIPKLYADAIPPTVDRIVSALPAWFHTDLWNFKVWQLFGVLVLIMLAFGLQKFAVFLISTYIRRIVAGLHVKWIENAAARIDRPIGGLVMAGVFHLMFPWLQFSVRTSQVARIGAQTLAAISVVWLGFRLVDVLTDWLGEKADKTDTKLDDQLVPMLRKVLKVFTAVIGFIFILQNLNVNVGSLLAGLGLGGLAFALAAKDSISNVFGSIVIFVDKPFQIGDWVVIGSVEGVVEEVGFRTTRVRTFYNSLVTVPNQQMTNVSIDNYGMRRYRRYKTTLGLTYDTPPEKMQAFCEGIRAIISGLPGMRKDSYLVEFHGFGDSGLLVFIYCFMEVPDWAAELRTRTNLNLEILRLADRLAVSFAFPTQTLHVETRAKETEIPTPKDLSNSELTGVIQAFGPGGELARPTGVSLSYGYDPGVAPPKGSDAAE